MHSHTAGVYETTLSTITGRVAVNTFQPYTQNILKCLERRAVLIGHKSTESEFILVLAASILIYKLLTEPCERQATAQRR